jgi:hypothetical protein
MDISEGVGNEREAAGILVEAKGAKNGGMEGGALEGEEVHGKLH